MHFLSVSHLCVRVAYTPPWVIKEKEEDEEGVGVSESKRESKVDWKKKERVRKEDKRGDLYFFLSVKRKLEFAPVLSLFFEGDAL